MAISSTPKLFRHGPSAEVRLYIFGVLAIVLIITDANMYVLEPVRQALATVLYPFQRIVLAPRDGMQWIYEWVNAAQLIRNENEALQRQRIELSQVTSHAAQLAIENAQLRRLLGVTGTTSQVAVAVEVLYEPPRLFNQRLVFNKGNAAGIMPGMPVIDEGGVVGQILRVTPMTSEASLVTNNGASIPVQNVRNGLRLIAFGGKYSATMEVRYLEDDADIQVGDTIVTSGVGGLFPAGLPVAQVQSIEHDTSSGFTHAIVEPLAHPERYRHFLVLKVDVTSLNPGMQEGAGG